LSQENVLKVKLMDVKMLASSILGGIVIALLTGLVPNTPPMFVGATHYGYPWAWLIRLVVAPEYFPWRTDVLNLIGDIIVWAIMVGIILLIVGKARK